MFLTHNLSRQLGKVIQGNQLFLANTYFWFTCYVAMVLSEKCEATQVLCRQLKWGIPRHNEKTNIETIRVVNRVRVGSVVQKTTISGHFLASWRGCVEIRMKFKYVIKCLWYLSFQSRVHYI